MEQLHTIYDRASKRCISLSKRSTVLLINGLYDKDYPLDSEVDYHWTEHHDEDLHRTLADTIITIQRTDSYHIEIQMYPDEEIVMRVFEYGYHHAITNRNGKDILIFPNPKILYLYEDGNVPEYQELLIDFGDQGSFTYKVPAFKYLQMSLEELNRKKLIVLIPFQLLRLRKVIEKERTPENLEALKYLISHDIMKGIKDNVAAGNLTISEGQKLKRITWQLYRHIYEKYEELGKAGIHTMVEDAMILDIDIIELEHKREMKRMAKELREQVTEEVTKEVTIAVKKEVTKQVSEEKDLVIRELVKKLRSMGVSEEEILSIAKLSLEQLKQLEAE